MSTTEGENKSPSRTNSIKEESKNLSIKNSSIYNPELLSKRNVIINTSTSKQMYSFSHAKRFKPKLTDESQFFYNIPTGMSHRGTSFGYGTKMSFSNRDHSPGPGSYNYLKINTKGRYAKSMLKVIFQIHPKVNLVQLSDLKLKKLLVIHLHRIVII